MFVKEKFAGRQRNRHSIETDELSIDSVLGNDNAMLYVLRAKYANWRVDNAEQVIRLCIAVGQWKRREKHTSLHKANCHAAGVCVRMYVCMCVRIPQMTLSVVSPS